MGVRVHAWMVAADRLSELYGEEARHHEADTFAEATPLLAGWAAASVEGLAMTGAERRRPRRVWRHAAVVGPDTAVRGPRRPAQTA
jgi:hypothetical protein